MKKPLATALLATLLTAAVSGTVLGAPLQASFPERTLVAATSSGPSAPPVQEGFGRAPGYLQLRAPAAPPASAPEAAGAVSGVLMLLAFLGLIAALLAHWSRDTSCRDERSVFGPEKEAA